MRVRLPNAALAIGFVLAGTAAQAQSTRLTWLSKTSGAILIDLCPTDRQAGFYDPCGGLLIGMIDGLSAGGVYCPPANFTTSQGEAIILSYVRENPEKWHQPAALLAFQALKRAFPCAKP